MKQLIVACVVLSFLCFVPGLTSAKDISVEDPGLKSLGILFTDYMSDENSFSFLLLNKNKEVLGQVQYAGILETTQSYYVEWNHGVTFLEYNHQEGIIQMSDEQGNEGLIITDGSGQFELSQEYRAISSNRRPEMYIMTATMRMFARMDDQGNLMENQKTQRGTGSDPFLCYPAPYLESCSKECAFNKTTSINNAVDCTNGRCTNEYCWGCCYIACVFSWVENISGFYWWCSEAYGYPCDSPY